MGYRLRVSDAGEEEAIGGSGLTGSGTRAGREDSKDVFG